MNVNDEFPKDEHNNDENIDDHDDIEEDNDYPYFGWGAPSAPPVFFCSGAFQIDPRDPRVMDNSSFILTMGILKPGNEKGVPKKIQSLIFEAGVKNQNFKLDPIALRFCMGL